MPNEQLYLRQALNSLQRKESISQYNDDFIALAHRFEGCHELDEAFYLLAGMKDLHIAVWRVSIGTLNDVIKVSATYDRGTMLSNPFRDSQVSCMQLDNVELAATYQCAASTTKSPGI